MRFGYVLLYVSEVEKAVRFYETAFGLPRKLIHENGYGEMDTGATKLGFVSHAIAKAAGAEYAEPSPDDPAPAVEIALLSDDVPAAYEKAVSAAVVAVAPPTKKPWGQTVACVRDLNGFLVELCTPTPE